MIYGELESCTFIFRCQSRTISFWTKLVDSPIENKLSSKVYRVIYEMHASNKVTSPWIKFVKNLLICSLGFPVIWYNQSFGNANWLVRAVNQKFKDVFIQFIWISQNCSMFRLAFVAGWLQGHWWGFISRNYVVWPTFLLMNVFTALKGSHFRFLFDFTAAGVVPCGGRKTSPRTSTIVQFIFYFGPLRSAIIFWEIRNK